MTNKHEMLLKDIRGDQKLDPLMYVITKECHHFYVKIHSKRNKKITYSVFK